jgi:hypothetical protein
MSKDEILEEVYNSINTDPEGIRTPEFHRIKAPPRKWIMEEIENNLKASQRYTDKAHRLMDFLESLKLEIGEEENET